MGIFGRNSNNNIYSKNNSSPKPTDVQEMDELRADLLDAESEVVSEVVSIEAQVSYTIDNAVKLMRQLPKQHIDTVVTVVKKTLESTEVDVDELINEAEKREDSLEQRMSVLKIEIEQLQKKIQIRQQEINVLDAEYREISQVKNYLLRAEELEEQQQQQQKNYDVARNAPIRNLKPDSETDSDDIITVKSQVTDSSLLTPPTPA